MLNTQDLSGQTPLHLAVEQNNPEMVKYMIEKGAVFHLTNSMEYTPYELACINREKAKINSQPEIISAQDEIIGLFIANTQAAMPGMKNKNDPVSCFFLEAPQNNLSNTFENTLHPHNP